MERKYYVCQLRLKGRDAFVIWYQDDRDGLVRGADDSLVWADTREGILERIAELGITLVDGDVANYALDRLRDWCSHPSSEAVDCPDFLSAWNLFDDVAGLHDHPDTPYAQLSRGAGPCYDTLFRGCNLPSMTLPGERFVPSWQLSELTEMSRVLAAGIGLLESKLGLSARAD